MADCAAAAECCWEVEGGGGCKWVGIFMVGVVITEVVVVAVVGWASEATEDKLDVDNADGVLVIILAVVWEVIETTVVAVETETVCAEGD